MTLIGVATGVAAWELVLVWVRGRIMMLATRIATTINMGRITHNVSSPFKFFTKINMAEFEG